MFYNDFTIPYVYLYITEVSSVYLGCGSSTVCPAMDSPSAYCDSCEFDGASQRCRSYVPKSTVDTQDQIDVTDKQSPELCLTEPVKIYSGTGFNFTGDDVLQLKRYFNEELHNVF